MRITKVAILMGGVAITGFLIGGWFMYLIDTTWIYNKVERRKAQLDSKMTQYTEALDVSYDMVNNCYDAFYTVSKCSTKDGCDFESTVDSLSELNFRRKILKLKLDQLLDGTDTSWSENQSL